MLDKPGIRTLRVNLFYLQVSNNMSTVFVEDRVQCVLFRMLYVYRIIVLTTAP